MLAVLIVVVAWRGPAWWMPPVFVAATAAPWVHAVGLLAAPTLSAAHPLRFIGAPATYLVGLALVAAALRVA
jgi:hypothetical protein